MPLVSGVPIRLRQTPTNYGENDAQCRHRPIGRSEPFAGNGAIWTVQPQKSEALMIGHGPCCAATGRAVIRAKRSKSLVALDLDPAAGLLGTPKVTNIAIGLWPMTGLC